MNKETIHPFQKESAFELALCDVLVQHGWEKDILVQPSEEDLVENWARIIFENNQEQERLGNYPLTASEMQQIVDQVNTWHSPYEINKQINGCYVCIKRDNPKDTHNVGKEVYLKIYDPQEISAGQSRYQIVRQPRFRAANPLAGDRRGDVLLLINGMPLFHIELKRSRVDVSEAVFQLKRYMHEGIFAKGIFSMVQIFVAMTPEKTLYFANPGSEDKFLEEFQFHWADFNNEEIHDWRRVATELLNIPMAHQLIGYYTIADDKDQTLKVLRSYQYYATNKICDVTHNTNWDAHEHKGGYIWHTTGSGKTMTSFKSAQLIANSGDADKVVFLLDRVELSIQSLDEYRGFAGENDDIQDTQNTLMLVSKLTSTDKDDRLIVTSIQKMANIKPSALIPEETIKKIGQKRLVFIIDECHRSVFGKMLIDIKNTFPRALLFGFTGTPVFVENAHNEITTETLFGDMLHKYTIASAIPDENVLGFDVYMVNTYEEEDLRNRVACSRLKIKSVDEIENDEDAMKKYDHFMHELEMKADYKENGEAVHGIEHYLPKDIYQQDIHHQEVAKHIVSKFDLLSHGFKFHAMLATQNIPEAIAYWKIFKEQYPSLNVVTVFDNNIDNSDEGIAKEDAILEMLEYYNLKYKTNFGLPNYGKYKKDVAKRLAHKKPYTQIEHDHSQQIDLLIVVTQMLTGYDSKWVNTLYVDKLMKYVDIIQAFSRTNRIFNKHEKPHGIIYYYSFPYTMEQNIQDALDVYVDRPLGVFVDSLEGNLNNINSLFLHIRDIFLSRKIMNFERLPKEEVDRKMFAKDFCQMARKLDAAKLQGFVWEKSEYEFKHGDTYTKVKMEVDEQTFQVLLQRYRELFEHREGGGERPDFDYPIDTYLTETGTGTIDADYINSKFVKFIKQLYAEGPGSELTKEALKELHKTFASLPQKDQRTAILILHDIQSGDLRLEPGKNILDYINEYQLKELYEQMKTLAEATGVNLSMLKNIMTSGATEENLDDFNRFSDLRITIDNTKTKTFLEKISGKTVASPFVMARWSKVLKDFILDAEMRERILMAWLNDDVTLQNAVIEQTSVDEEFEKLETPSEEPTKPVVSIEVKAKKELESIISSTLGGVSGMRPMNEIANSVFYVLDKESIPSLDSVGIYIHRAFTNLYKDDATIVDKFVAFNLLVTKFEAYLKKLYFLMKGEEVRPQYEGEDVTWANVIHDIKPLWKLKYNTDEASQRLYQWLLMVKEWRNSESHISPTASEEELNAAIKIIATMYCYATGACIIDLKRNGHDMGGSRYEPQNIPIYSSFGLGYDRAAESFVPVTELTEQQKIDILHKSLTQMIHHGGYKASDRTFCKQRHWIAIYRIAADEGFIIDGDFNHFKHIVEEMKLPIEDIPLKADTLAQTVKGVYAKSFVDWRSDGLSGRRLNEYNDIKHCAEVFKQILAENRPKR